MNSVQSDQSGDEIRRDAFEIATELGHRDIATEETFVDAFERAQKSPHIRPHAFEGVDVNFPNTIAVIIPCPFMFTVIHGGMRTDQCDCSLTIHRYSNARLPK